jgi:hypothetical protein
MTTQRWITIGSATAIAGGMAFLVKLAVLAATDGAESIAVATFYFLGNGLCALGSIGVALRLLQRRALPIRIGGAMVAPIAFAITFLWLDSVVVPLTREHVPAWAEVEGGVFLTALIWLAAGTWALRTRGAAMPATQAARGA